MLGEKWKTLSEKQRQPYEAKAATDKKRYEEEKVAYQVNTHAHMYPLCTPTDHIQNAAEEEEEESE